MKKLLMMLIMALSFGNFAFPSQEKGQNITILLASQEPKSQAWSLLFVLPKGGTEWTTIEGTIGKYENFSLGIDRIASEATYKMYSIGNLNEHNKFEFSHFYVIPVKTFKSGTDLLNAAKKTGFTVPAGYTAYEDFNWTPVNEIMSKLDFTDFKRGTYGKQKGFDSQFLAWFKSQWPAIKSTIEGKSGAALAATDDVGSLLFSEMSDGAPNYEAAKKAGIEFKKNVQYKPGELVAIIKTDSSIVIGKIEKKNATMTKIFKKDNYDVLIGQDKDKDKDVRLFDIDKIAQLPPNYKSLIKSAPSSAASSAAIAVSSSSAATVVSPVSSATTPAIVVSSKDSKSGKEISGIAAQPPAKQVAPLTAKDLEPINEYAGKFIKGTGGGKSYPYIDPHLAQSFLKSAFYNKELGYALYLMDNPQVAEQVLLDAIVNENIPMIQLLLRVPGININRIFINFPIARIVAEAHDAISASGLTIAAAIGNATIVDLLIQAWADINSFQDAHYMSPMPLTLSIAYGKVNALKRLLQEQNLIVSDRIEQVEHALQSLDNKKIKEQILQMLKRAPQAQSIVANLELFEIENNFNQEYQQANENSHKIAAYNHFIDNIDAFIVRYVKNNEVLDLTLALLTRMKANLIYEKFLNYLHEDLDVKFKDRIRELSQKLLLLTPASAISAATPSSAKDVKIMSEKEKIASLTISDKKELNEIGKKLVQDDGDLAMQFLMDKRKDQPLGFFEILMEISKDKILDRLFDIAGGRKILQTPETIKEFKNIVSKVPGLNLNENREYIGTLLIEVADNSELTDSLLKAGADPNIRATIDVSAGQGGYPSLIKNTSPLQNAMRFNAAVDVILRLLQVQNINVKEDGQQIVEWAQKNRSKNQKKFGQIIDLVQKKLQGK